MENPEALSWNYIKDKFSDYAVSSNRVLPLHQIVELQNYCNENFPNAWEAGMTSSNLKNNIVDIGLVFSFENNSDMINFVLAFSGIS